MFTTYTLNIALGGVTTPRLSLREMLVCFDRDSVSGRIVTVLSENIRPMLTLSVSARIEMDGSDRMRRAWMFSVSPKMDTRASDRIMGALIMDSISVSGEMDTEGSSRDTILWTVLTT